MLASPKRAIDGPNEPPPASAGPSRTIARLIRERPVFVNVAGAAVGNEFTGQNSPEIMDFPQLAEPAVRYRRRPVTLPQSGFFETAHFASHISSIAGFSLSGRCARLACRRRVVPPTLSNCNLTDSRASRIVENASQ